MGKTFGMCVLQDFEALTPNLLARTIETVEGGGIVVLLLKTMTSLKQLYTLAMDVHSRFRTESHQHVVGRFNERFILSLTKCDACIIADDELNVLPITAGIRSLAPVDRLDAERAAAAGDEELRQLRAALEGHEPAHSLLGIAKTPQQATVLLQLIDAIQAKTLRRTVSLTAARGRGKSATLGMALGAAIAFGYANIFVTSPHPDNLQTLFQFIFKSLDALGFEERADYEIVQSTNPDFNNAVVRINVFREHRQTIQYIDPQDSARLAQAELLVVDEAAAVPLPWLRRLFGPYLVFLATTTGGYEGTGRALELKLLKELRASAAAAAAAAATAAADGSSTASTTATTTAAAAATATTSAGGGRTLQEVVLETPIRYAANDPIERWLNELLCLDTRAVVRVAPTYFPPIEQCQLYSVNRDTLMSYHAASEQFLQSLVSLFVASHYRNTPNDLLMLADAPAHHIFVLLGPLPDDDGGAATALPAILCAVHVCMEGAITADIVRAQQARGQASSGDLIPWTLAQHFQDSAVAGLSGARIVRIATHPSCVKKGYGTRALELLLQHFQRAGGGVADDSDGDGGVEPVPSSALERDDDELATLRESLAPRKTLPPLLTPLEQLPARRLDWIGTSFGLTPELYRFWRRNGYTALYVRQSPSEVTGEHSCIMLRAFDEQADWLSLFSADFRERLLALFGYAFSALPLPLSTALLMDRAGSNAAAADDDADAHDREADLDADDDDDRRRRRATGSDWSRMLDVLFSRFDVKRLDSYARNLLDYNEILDLVPELARCYFRGAFRPMQLTPTQAVVLLGVGLQHKSLEQVAIELSFPRVQAVAQFNKLARRIAAVFGERAERAEALPMAPAAVSDEAAPRSVLSLDAELAGGKLGARAQVRAQRNARAKLEAEQAAAFDARTIDDDQAAELADMEREGVSLTTVSLRSTRPTNDDDGIVYDRMRAKKGKQQSKRGRRGK